MAISPRVTRILSLDGAGLYGLTATLWLKELCKQNPSFLTSPMVDLFAGTSSGAIAALMMASEEDPRQAIPRIEAFWHAAEPWQNRKNPMEAVLSLTGLTAWYGTQDFLDYLTTVFGDQRLCDLRHKVLITSYDLSGQRGAGYTDTPRRAGVAAWTEAPAAAFTHLHGIVCDSTNGDPARHSRPLVITNFLKGDEAFLQWRVADLAYAATAMPALRAIRFGIGDGGVYNANPSALALSAAVDLDTHDMEEGPERTEATATILDKLAMLSLGDGCRQPWYWLSDFNFGAMPWLMSPVNPLFGPYSPMAFTLQAPAQMADLVVSQLIGPKSHHRLNPGILALPTGVTVYAARIDPLRSMMVGLVESAVRSKASQDATERALNFTRSAAWTGKTNGTHHD